MAQTVKWLPTMRETWVQSLGREDLLEKEIATCSVFLPRKSHGWRSLVSYSPWGCKESDMTKQLHILCRSKRPSGGSVIQNLPVSVRDVDSIPGSGRSPGEWNDNPLQYCCLENSMDRGAWWATVNGVTKSWT